MAQVEGYSTYNEKFTDFGHKLGGRRAGGAHWGASHAQWAPHGEPTGRLHPAHWAQIGPRKKKWGPELE